MACVAWLLAVVVVCVLSPGVGGQCRNGPHCRDYNLSDDRIMESSKQQPSKESLFLDFLASLASGEKTLERKTDSQPRSKDRRSYSMEHFRWGKPTGRKRRPAKVHTQEGEDSVQVRRQLGSVGDGRPGRQWSSRSRGPSPLSLQDKRDGNYRMGHFRWGSPPTTKRSRFMWSREA